MYSLSSGKIHIGISFITDSAVIVVPVRRQSSMNNEAAFEATMMRVEHKFPMNAEQQAEFLKRAMPHLRPDRYPEYDLHNIYYDTADNALIINCLNHPQYKEKLRLRTYGEPNDSTPCYLEIKKKFRETGVKRRIAVSETEAHRYMQDRIRPDDDSQIAREIEYLVEQRDLKEKMFIAYHRKAFSGITEADLRITFDTDICYRLNNLSLHKTGEETMITDPDEVLMEVKVSNRYPIWLTEILSDMKLYRRTFSKYGTIYAELTAMANNEPMHYTMKPAGNQKPAAGIRKENKQCLAQF